MTEFTFDAPTVIRTKRDGGVLSDAAIDWVIVGGESGPGARPMKREWVISLRRQCRQQNVPFFFKQWGGVRKSKAGRLLDGRTYDEMPTGLTPPVFPILRLQISAGR